MKKYSELGNRYASKSDWKDFALTKLCACSIDEEGLRYRERNDRGEEVTAAFAEKLTDFEVSKGTIRLPHDLDLPEELIADIAKWCYASYSK